MGHGEEEPGTPRRVTLRDVAARAGVHPSTVSRILSQSGVNASTSPTAKRIRRIAAELDYEPDPWAASLRSRRTRTIGVVMPRLSDMVVATLYEVIEAAARAHGFRTLLVGTQDTATEQQHQVELLLTRRVDGLLLGATALDDPLPSRLTDKGVPFVSVLRRCGSHPSVSIDDERGGYLATRHLIERGHRHIGMVNGPTHTSTACDRREGYRRALREAGLELEPEMIAETGFFIEAGREGAALLMAGDERPTALFAVTDYAALGVVGYCREQGLQVGRDFALVGYHDMAISSQLSIPLSSVHSPLEAIGLRAVDMLLTQIEGRTIEPVRVEPSLVVRESSGATHGEMTS
jgi:LacI family transcriptional regulator